MAKLLDYSGRDDAERDPMARSSSEARLELGLVYAPLIISEQLDQRIDVHLTDGEDLATGIALVLCSRSRTHR
jgi:hypothetical protein